MLLKKSAVVLSLLLAIPYVSWSSGELCDTRLLSLTGTIGSFATYYETGKIYQIEFRMPLSHLIYPHPDSIDTKNLKETFNPDVVYTIFVADKICLGEKYDRIVSATITSPEGPRDATWLIKQTAQK